MLVSLKWLSEYVPLTLPPRELAERLTLAGVKGERIISRGDEWEGISVARVLQVAPHPNADRLRLVTVDLAGPAQPTVVCGAPNVAVRPKVAFAPPRARAPPRRPPQGTPERAGAAPVGQPLRDYLGDTLFELEVTPNRPDHLSMLGVAKVVAQ